MDINMTLTVPPEDGFLGLATNDDLPVVVGKGNINYHCGNCGNIVGKTLVKGQTQNFGIICPKCGWTNKFD